MPSVGHIGKSMAGNEHSKPWGFLEWVIGTRPCLFPFQIFLRVCPEEKLEWGLATWGIWAEVPSPRTPPLSGTGFVSICLAAILGGRQPLVSQLLAVFPFLGLAGSTEGVHHGELPLSATSDYKEGV